MKKWDTQPLMQHRTLQPWRLQRSVGKHIFNHPLLLWLGQRWLLKPHYLRGMQHTCWYAIQGGSGQGMWHMVDTGAEGGSTLPVLLSPFHGSYSIGTIGACVYFLYMLILSYLYIINRIYRHTYSLSRVFFDNIIWTLVMVEPPCVESWLYFFLSPLLDRHLASYTTYANIIYNM